MNARTPLLAAATLAVLATSAHALDIQDDVRACGEAAVAAGLITEEARLRFVDDEGNRNRVLTLRALSDTTEPVDIDCRMNRTKVREVVPTEG